MHLTRFRRRLADEQGTALIIALMSTMLLTALGAVVIMVSNTEVIISGNYRNSQEALYAADAAVERVVQELLMIPRWNDILEGHTVSGFIDGAASGPKALPAGGQINLATATDTLNADYQTVNLWGSNNPVWRLFAWGPIDSLLPNGAIDSAMYVAVWIADDPADSPDGETIDGNPLADSNGVLNLRAEAFGPSGTRKVIEVTVARTSSTEIERGQIAQRGQEELNQRARKAAVQTPGKALTRQSMDVRTGSLQ
jgi:hypothetical protein